MIDRIKHICAWLPVLWRDRDWDYLFLLRIIEFKLKRMAKFIEANDSTVGTKEYIREMRVCATLLNRLLEDSYCSKEIDRLVGDNPMRDLNQMEVEQYKKILKKVDNLRTQDEDLFFKLFKQNYKHWWD